MPNRIIKESIKRNPEIDRLTWFEEVVFYRLIVTADDYGRIDGRPIVLRNDLFPTKETITKKAIEDAISKLVSVGLLIRYVDAESNTPYLAFPRWEKHQTIRNKHSKYPAPPEDLLANCKQLISDCNQLSADCMSESESNPNPNPNRMCGATSAPTRTRFVPPSVDDVRAYCIEQGYRIDPERFVAYYESNGWKVGRNPMRDWRAACRTWARGDSTGAKPNAPTPTALQFDQRDYTGVDLSSLNVDLEKYRGGT